MWLSKLFPWMQVVLWEGDTGGAGGGAGGAGAGSGGGTGDDPGKKDGKQDPPPDPEKKFSQADVDRIVGERATRAAEAAVSKLLGDLGVKDVTEAKAALDKSKQLEEAQLSELDKAKKEAEAQKAKADQAEKDKAAALARATETLMRSAVLAEAGKPDYKVRPDALADVWTFIDKSTIKPKEGTDEFEGVADAVKAVLKAKPYLADDGKRPVGTPRPDDKRKTPSADTTKAAQDAARRRTHSGF